MLLNKKIKKIKYCKKYTEINNYISFKNNLYKCFLNSNYFLNIILKNCKKGLKLKIITNFLLSYKFLYKIKKKKIDNILDFFAVFKIFYSILTKKLIIKKKLKLYSIKILNDSSRNQEILLWIKKIIQHQPYKKLYLRLFYIFFDIVFFYKNNIINELKILVYNTKIPKKKKYNESIKNEAFVFNDCIFFDEKFNLKLNYIKCDKKSLIDEMDDNTIYVRKWSKFVF